jgi:hypothetical protein
LTATNTLCILTGKYKNKKVKIFMKIQKLNPRGFSHHFALVIVVLAMALGGTYQLVASHAASITNTHVPTGSISVDNCSAVASGSENDGDRPNDGARVIVTVYGAGGVDVNSGSSSWSYAIPATYKDGQNHTINATGRNVDSTAQNAGTNPVLSGSPAVYNSANCASTPPSTTGTGATAANAQPSGTVSLDVCSATVSGTESDSDRPNDGARVIVTVYGAGGVDVNSGSSSWSYAIPAAYKDGQNHTINVTGRNVNSSAQNSGTNPVLSGSPVTFNSRNCATPSATQQPAAPGGTTVAASVCAKDYLKDSAGQCYTVVKPTCPSGTTLHTGKDPSTSQPRYFCQTASGVNVSEGSTGITPPAIVGLSNGKTVSCGVLNNQGVRVTVQTANQAACTALVNQDIPCGYFNKKYEHVTVNMNRTDCAIALKNQTNPDNKPLACRVLNGDGNYKTVKSTVGGCPDLATKAERDRNVIVVKSTKVLCDYVDGKGYYFSQALLEKSDCNNKQTHSNDHDCKAYIQQQLGIAGSSAAECIIAHENSKSLPRAKFKACSWYNAEGNPVSVTNLNPTLCEQRQLRERFHGPKTVPAKKSTVAATTPSSAVRNDPDNKRASSASKTSTVKTTTVKATATPKATNQDCILHNSKGGTYTSNQLSRGQCVQAQQDYKDSVSQTRATATKAAEAKAAKATAASAVAHKKTQPVSGNGCSALVFDGNKVSGCISDWSQAQGN